MGDSAALHELGEERDPGQVVVAIDDALFSMLPEPHAFTADGVRVVYVAASSLEDPDRDSDLWIGRYAPSAPGRRLLFQTMSGATYETDAERRVWRAGVLVFAGVLVDFGVPRTNERGILRAGEPAALLFMTHAVDGWHMRVRVTTPVLFLADVPGAAERIAPPPRWLSLARHLLREGGA